MSSKLKEWIKHLFKEYTLCVNCGVPITWWEAFETDGMCTVCFGHLYREENGFQWQGTEDDLMCKIENSTLRVEQMDKDSWWWRVMHNDKIADESFTSTKESAIEHAEQAYFNTK